MTEPALARREEQGLVFVEGAPAAPLMRRADDASLVIEACLSWGTSLALVYAENLTPEFFDLSSGHAGAILQRLRNYEVRLSVVCPPGAARFSHRFGELLAEERRGRHFTVVETRSEAVAWLASP